jgi:LysM repeat protein
MKILALYSIAVSILVSSVSGQTQSDVEFLRARADAHERKISQLEKDLTRLKALLSDKQTGAEAATSNVSVEPLPSDSSHAKTMEYVVKPGDVLSRIASAYKSSVAAIRKQNHLTTDRIVVGQRLQIPVDGVTKGSVKSSAKVSSPPAKKVMEHMVQGGETFYSIARLHGVSIHSLQSANPNVVPTKMYVGQRLRLDGNANQKAKAMLALQSQSITPAAKKAITSMPKDAQTSNATKSSAHKQADITSNTNSEPKVRTITVDHQITYGQFASSHGASTTQLNELNGLSLSGNTTLAKGSELYVPQF